MFKNVIQSISKSLKKQVEAPAAKKTEKTAPAAPAPEAKKAPEPAAPPKVEPPKSADELCGIAPKMTKDQIKEKLKLLYRRYNRAASSLDAATRAEAEKMLDAIVAVREKAFGEI